MLETILVAIIVALASGYLLLRTRKQVSRQQIGNCSCQCDCHLARQSSEYTGEDCPVEGAGGTDRQ